MTRRTQERAVDPHRRAKQGKGEELRGRLWIGTASGPPCFDNAVFRNFWSQDGLTTDYVWFLHTDREGSLWIGTNGGGLNRALNTLR
ncbi:MAG: hypothetical protein HYX75_25720 [Acidobacteria bacterium]|nr:hypothetical protein [Acidobacteriota bacterium]